MIRSGVVADSFDAGGRTELRLAQTVADLGTGEYVYVRAVQIDDGAAWSSPIFVR